MIDKWMLLIDNIKVYIWYSCKTTKRFESFCIHMAVIYKNKNKIFKIRRKKLNWFEKKSDLSLNKALTINSYVWTTVYKNIKKRVNVLPQVYTNYSNSLITLSFVKTENLLQFNNTSLNIYINYCSKIVLENNNIAPKEFNLNLIVLSTPKTQLFFTLFKNKTLLVFTCGIIRIVMQLIDKCSKKKNIVILNSIKFMWSSSLLNFNGGIKIKFKKNFSYIRMVFNKNYNEAKSVDYIFFEPKINFGFKDFNKRASIKKKLRKKKKYISE